MLTPKTARRVHSDERGVALVVVMAMIVVLGAIATAVLTNALQVKNATASERASKQAYAAAISGVRSAMFWLNASVPGDTACPPLPGQTTAQTPNTTSGVCGPYESDNISGAPGVTSQPTVDQRFTYWITPVLSSTTDTCTGTAPVVTSPDPGITVRDRCITAVGESVRGTQITSTRRVQARVSATNAQFPVAGIFGARCLSIGVSSGLNLNTTDCVTGNGASNSNYYGTIGSNGTIDAQMKEWRQDPTVSTSTLPAKLWLGYTSPGSGTIPSYTIKVGNTGAIGASPSGCGGLTYCNGSSPPLPYNPSASPPYPNPPHLLGRYFPLPRMGDVFAQPYPMQLGGHTLPSGCTTTDVVSCNNNSLITSAPGCATLDSNRVFNVPDACIVRIPNGTYDFCDIKIGGRNAAVLPADQTATAEIRIFLDNKNRTVNGSPACTSSTTGAFTWNGNGSNVPRWMTNNQSTNVGPDECVTTAFNADPWTALAGQIFVYGEGDPLDATTNYPPRFNSAFSIPGIVFNGAIIATNSTVDLYQSNTCVNGAILAAAINTATNVGFKWDTTATKIQPPLQDPPFYRTAFSSCGTAGFRFNDTSAPTYPTYPSDGC